MACRTWNQHFVSLDREYIDEAHGDTDALYKKWSFLMGKPALVIAPEQCIDLA